MSNSNPPFDSSSTVPGGTPMVGVGDGPLVEQGGEHGASGHEANAQTTVAGHQRVAYLEHMLEQMSHGFTQLQRELTDVRRQQEEQAQRAHPVTAGENFVPGSGDHAHVADHVRPEPFANSHGPVADNAASNLSGSLRGFTTSNPNVSRAALKIDPPSHFKGNRRDDAVKAFVIALRDYMDFVSARSWFANEAERVYFASTRLEGEAAKAWVTKRSQLGSTCDSAGASLLQQFTLEDFYQWLLRRFEDVNAQDKRRQSYDMCRQGSRSVGAYAMDLENLADGLDPRVPDYELLAKFKSGLSGDILVEMARVRPSPTVYEEYRNLADSIDRSIYAAKQVGRNGGFRRVSNGPPSNWSNQTASSGSSGPVPMDLGAVQISKGSTKDARMSKEYFASRRTGKRAGSQLSRFVDDPTHKPAEPPPEGENASDTGEISIEKDLEHITSLLAKREAAEDHASLVEVDVHVNGRSTRALIDSGASRSCVSRAFAALAQVRIERTSSEREAMLPNGQRIAIAGQATLPLQIGTYQEDIEAAVLELSGFDLILGVSWLRQAKAKSDWETGRQEVWDRHGNAHHLGPAPLRLFTIAADGVAGDVELMSYRQARRAVKERQLMYVGWVRTTDSAASDLSRDALNSIDTSSNQKTKPAECGGTIDLPVESSGNADIDKVLARFRDVFRSELPEGEGANEVGSLRTLEASMIDTGSSAPINRRAYNLTPTQLEEQSKQVQDLLRRGLIRESSSPWGFPVLFVPKKDGGWRMCIDYRALNEVTKRNGYPLPLIQQCLDSLGKAKRFSKVDMTSGYWQIRLLLEDVAKTAFNTRHGKFEFLVMPFGLTNAPSVFQTLVNNALRKHIDVFVIVYLDDILIYSFDEVQHCEHVETVLRILQQHKLYAKPTKCFFNRTEIEFCGHLVGQGTVRPLEDKLRVVKEWPRPKSIHEVRSFLGLAAYYRRFAKNFATVAAPLFELLKKKTGEDKKAKFAPVVWNFACQRAFDDVKTLLCTSPALRQPDTTRPFTIETDASDWAIGCVLSQSNSDGHLQPVAYDGRKMNEAEQRYPVHEKELLAIRHALRIWRHYVDNGMTITILTDHESLKYMPTTKVASKRLARWVAEFGEYDLELRYRRGADNAAADAISRRPDFLASLVEVPLEVPHMAAFLSGTPIPESQQSLVRSKSSKYQLGPDGELLRKIEGNLTAPYLDPPHRLMFMEKMHSEYGHLGGIALGGLVQSRAWWPGMRHDLTKFCRSCPICQVCQRPRTGQEREFGVLMAEAKVRPFERWGIDLIGILPETADGNKWLVTAVDYCTGWPLARALPDAKAWRIADFIYEDIFMNFGCPREVISDNGENFLANAVEHLFEHMKTKHRLATAYHPRTNGKVENLNGTLGRMLTKFVVGQPTRVWDRYLSRALFACRVRTHSTTGFSPFYLVYGTEPQLPTDEPPPRILDVSVEDPESRLDALRTDRTKAQDRTLARARKAKEKYDQLVRPHQLTVGSYVLVRHESPQKFEAKWFGPYRVASLQTLGTYGLETLSGHPLRALVHGNRLLEAKVRGTDRTIRRMWSDPNQRAALRSTIGVDWADASAAVSEEIRRDIESEYAGPAGISRSGTTGQEPPRRRGPTRTDRQAPSIEAAHERDTAAADSVATAQPDSLVADPSVPATVDAPRRRVKIVWRSRRTATPVESASTGEIRTT